MAVVTKHMVESESFVQVSTEDRVVYLDYSSPLYGRNFRVPTFSSPPRPLSFIVKQVRAPDAIFITNSHSVGCVFLTELFREHVPIYITAPVLEQILMRVQEYAFSEAAFDNEPISDSSYKVVSIADADIECFKRSVTLVNFNEIIRCGTLSISMCPAGTFVGWSYLRILFENKASLSYVSSYSTTRRLAAEAVPIDSEYLILNIYPSKHLSVGLQGRDTMPRSVNKKLEVYRNDVNALSSEILGAGSPILIPIRFETLFMEVVLHVFSLFEHRPIPIYAISHTVQKLEALIGNQGEWLSKRFSQADDPFPIRAYPRFSAVETLEGLKICDLKEHTVVFCSDLVVPRISANQRIMYIGTRNDYTPSHLSEKPGASNYFSIGIELTDDTIKELFLNGIDPIAPNHKSIQRYVITDTPFTIRSQSNYHTLNISGDINVASEYIYTFGALTHTDERNAGRPVFSIDEGKNPIKEAFADDKLIVDGEWYLNMSRNIKMRMINGMIEYAQIEQ